jgi:magnesium transporter
VRAYEIVDSYRDLVANTLDAYLAATSNRLGMVMKQLTVIATIFMPLSFLTGFFGMNFTSIPYDRPWLFAMLLLVMLGLPIAMVFVFARCGWIADHRRTTVGAWMRALFSAPRRRDTGG